MRTTKLKAGFMARGIATLDYDAINLAGWDFFLGEKFLRDLGNEYKLPLVSANIRYKDTGSHFARPYIIKRYGGKSFLGIEYGGVKVGVFGLAKPAAIERIKPQQGDQPLIVDDPTESASRVVCELRGKCALVIMLTDLETSQSRELAKRVEGIDLIIGGRMGAVEGLPEKEGTTYLAVVGAKGWYEGDLLLSLNPRRGLESIESHSRLLDDKIEGDSGILELIQEYKKERK